MRNRFRRALVRTAAAWGLAAVLAASAFAAAPSAGGVPPGPLRRFALAAGANNGGPSRIQLRYAGTDAANFAAVMKSFGGVAAEDVRVLREPGRREFLAALGDMRRRIAAANAAGQRAELLVYFSGHSDESGLMLGSERLGYAEFRARIDSIPARIRVAVVDACASGALIRIKGGSRLPAFSVDQSSNLSGYAFLTSSSGAEAAQESDRIRASFFTHYLISGLRGAADRNQDGRVTLGEAYAFAFQETLAQTEGSQAGAQHPGYDMRLTGTGDLVLTDLRGTSAGLALAPGLRGRLFVRSATGDLVAELQKQAGAKVELGLDPGLYDLNLEQGDSLFHALVKVDSLTHAPLARADLTPVLRDATRRRGGPTEAKPPEAKPSEPPVPPPTGVPLRAALVPALGYPGIGSGPWSHNLSLSLVLGRAAEIRGLQISFGANVSEGEMAGGQIGMLNIASGPSKGLQLALAANGRASDHSGIQIALVGNQADTLVGLQAGGINHAGWGRGLQAGLVNAAGAFTGIQAGLLNAASRQWGVQAGLLNVAANQRGIQAALINVADTARGLQVGLINYATYGKGYALGPINIILNGMHDAEMTFDDRSMLRTAFLLGGPYNYNYLSFDMKARYPRHLWGGSTGTGVHVPYGRAFFDADAGIGLVLNEYEWENYSVTGRLRGIAGFSAARYFNVFFGLTYNSEAWPGTQRPNLNPEIEGEAWGDDIRAHRWGGFVLGVRI